MATRVFYRRPGVGFQELEFLRWTPRYLVVRYPASGKEWLMDRRAVKHWVERGSLLVEGEAPADWRELVARMG